MPPEEVHTDEEAYMDEEELPICNVKHYEEVLEVKLSAWGGMISMQSATHVLNQRSFTGSVSLLSIALPVVCEHFVTENYDLVTSCAHLHRYMDKFTIDRHITECKSDEKQQEGFIKLVVLCLQQEGFKTACVFEDDHCWFNRAWTPPEISDGMLIAEMTYQKDSTVNERFMTEEVKRRMDDQLTSLHQSWSSLTNCLHSCASKDQLSASSFSSFSNLQSLAMSPINAETLCVQVEERLNDTCISLDHYGEGTYHKAGTVFIRVSHHCVDETNVPMRSSNMRYIKKHTSVSVPNVFAYDPDTDGQVDGMDANSIWETLTSEQNHKLFLAIGDQYLRVDLNAAPDPNKCDNTPIILDHPDFSMQNIIVRSDDPMVIAGIID
ncbi:hypothetical protein EDD18DRAFT_1112514 [Armillaria luteobubalina]|uniref:Uncharacterized protein n=1 Tax=Armillaria luteobubalina TaxID=153913 RepID=A0AA39UHK3_9AGAR|nr:hypothetical protein EDD18DRAFT_1112514 [Armillaria luteobubalina]